MIKTREDIASIVFTVKAITLMTQIINRNLSMISDPLTAPIISAETGTYISGTA